LTVSFGGVAATSVTVVNSNVITAVTPAHGAGAVTVLESNPAVGNVSNGNAVLLAGYTYTATPGSPQVTSVTPPSGPLAGGTNVSIAGNYFLPGATVTFGGAAATNVAFVNPARLTATTPANTAGIKAVTVTNPSTANGTLANGFMYADPVGAADFYPVTPCRLVDTRDNTLGAPILAANSTRTFVVTGQCGVPADAKSVSINVSAIPGTSGGVLSLYPGDGFATSTSAVSFNASVVRSGAVVALLALNGNGTLGVLNASAAATHMTIDVNGYFK
jgi:hypothetical protein